MSDELLASVLEQACEIMASDHAEVLFPGPQGQESQLRVTIGPLGVHRQELRRGGHGAWMEQVVLQQGLAVVLPRGSKVAHVQQWLAEESHRDALVVPLAGTSGIIGMLVVADRRGEVRTFDDQDVLLLETLANHASVAMQKGELSTSPARRLPRRAHRAAEPRRFQQRADPAAWQPAGSARTASR